MVFGQRGGSRMGGFDRPPQAPVIESLQQALYPQRVYHYFPPAMLAAAANGPRIPSASLELSQNAKPLSAAELLTPLTAKGSAEHHVKLLFQEALPGQPSPLLPMTTVTAASQAVAVASLRCIHAVNPCECPEASVLVAAANCRTGLPTTTPLPAELRIYTMLPLTEAERRNLYRIRHHKRPKVTKPVRRGGIVVSSAPLGVLSKSSKASSTSGKPKVSALVGAPLGAASLDTEAAAAAGGDDGEGGVGTRKRPRGAEDGGGSDGDEGEEREESVSTVNDVDDDDEGMDDASGGGSGDELLF